MIEPAIFAKLAHVSTGGGWSERCPARDDGRSRKPITVSTGHLDLLLSAVYDSNRPNHPLHRDDLYKSGLTDAAIAIQKFTTVPPAMLTVLLGFNPVKVVSAYLIPFADPRGGWMPHIRMKVSLPFIRRAGSRGSPSVFVMQPAHAWQLHHPTLARPLHTPRRRRVLGQ